MKSCEIHKSWYVIYYTACPFSWFPQKWGRWPYVGCCHVCCKMDWITWTDSYIMMNWTSNMFYKMARLGFWTGHQRVQPLLMENLSTYTQDWRQGNCKSNKKDAIGPGTGTGVGHTWNVLLKDRGAKMSRRKKLTGDINHHLRSLLEFFFAEVVVKTTKVMTWIPDADDPEKISANFQIRNRRLKCKKNVIGSKGGCNKLHPKARWWWSEGATNKDWKENITSVQQKL